MSLREVFTTRFRSALDRAGISQRELARRMNVAHQTVQSWAQGKNWPQNPETVDEISEILNTNSQWLMGAGVASPSPLEALEIVKNALMGLPNVGSYDTVINSLNPNQKRVIDNILEGYGHRLPQNEEVATKE